MGGCCRSPKVVAPPLNYDSPLCSNCKHDMLKMFQSAAASQTRGRLGGSTTLVRLNCPKCNAVNAYKVNVVRKVEQKR